MPVKLKKQTPDLFRILRLTLPVFLIILAVRIPSFGQEKSRFKQRLEWVEDSNAFEYKIEIRTTGKNTQVEGSAKTSGNVKGGAGKSKFFSTEENYIELTLVAGDYEYRVYALDFLGKESSVSEWRGFTVIKAQTPKIEELKQNVVVSANDKVTFDVPLDVSSITKDTVVELINQDTKEKIKGELEFKTENGEIVSSNAVFPEVPAGNWKAKITNPSGLYSETAEIEVAKTVEKAKEIAKSDVNKIYIQDQESLKAEKKAEEKRLAEEARLAEEKRLAEEARIKAEEIAKAEAEAKALEEEKLRLALEEEQKLAKEEELRLAKEEAEKKAEADKLEAERLAEAAKLEAESKNQKEIQQELKANSEKIALLKNELAEEKKELQVKIDSTEKTLQEQDLYLSPQEKEIISEKLDLLEQRKSNLEESEKLAQSAEKITEELIQKAEELQLSEVEIVDAGEALPAETVAVEDFQKTLEAIAMIENKETVRQEVEKTSIEEEEKLDKMLSKVQEEEEKRRLNERKLAENSIEQAQKENAQTQKAIQGINTQLENFEKARLEAEEELKLAETGEITEARKEFVQQSLEYNSKCQELTQKSADLAEKKAELEEKSKEINKKLLEVEETKEYKQLEEVLEEKKQIEQQLAETKEELDKSETERQKEIKKLSKLQKKNEQKYDNSVKDLKELYLTIGATGMYSFYDGQLSQFMMDSPVWGEGELKLTWVPFSIGSDKLGVSAGIKGTDLRQVYSGIVLNIPYIHAELNFEYQKSIIPGHLYGSLHGGAGILVISDLISYTIDTIKEEPDLEFFGYMCAQAGAGIVWTPGKWFTVELGCDYTHLFIPEMQTEIIEPYLLFGSRL